MNLELLKKGLRTVPDFPKEGILFWDLTTLFKDPEAFRFAVDSIYEIYKDKGITKVVSLEARGYMLGSALAYRLGAGFIPVRKPGKLPAATWDETYMKEYGPDTLCIHQDALEPDDIVLLHDDLLATGGSAAAALRLIDRFGPKEVYANFIIELNGLDGRKALPEDVDVTSLLRL
ncbi:MAG: adenine phosphoribosyltransferase [Candidatus Cryptobacteroides sp.]